jgi:hypothetical protein
MPSINKPSKLALCWQSQLASVIKTAPPPLTSKQAGQLKQLYRKSGLYAEQVISFAMTHWCEITTSATLNKGLVTCPHIPHIGFLLAHCNEALGLMIKKQLLKPEDFNRAMTVLYGPDWMY